MNTKKITIGSVVASLVLPVLAFAQLDYHPPVGGAPQIGSLQQIIGAIENAAALVFGGIAVIMFIVAGVLFLTAQGDPEKVQKARGAFIWGVAGVVVGLISFSILAIVASFLR